MARASGRGRDHGGGNGVQEQEQHDGRAHVYYSFARHRPFTLEHTSLEYAARSRHRTAHGQIPLEPAGKQQRFVRSLLPKLEAVGAPRVVARRAQHSPMVVSEHPETIRLAGKHRVAKLASACRVDATRRPGIPAETAGHVMSTRLR